MDYIETRKLQYPTLADEYEKLGNLYSKKLWHELTIALDDFLKNEKIVHGDEDLELYSSFVSKCETRLNQVRVAQIVSLIGAAISEPEKAISFFESVLANRARLGEEAALCIDMDVVLAKLKLGLENECKNILEETKEKINTMRTTESIAFSKFYFAFAEYKKRVGPPHEFYKAGLMFLVYCSPEQMPTQQRYVLATDLALAAATGENIFNFGEVLETPILRVLEGTPNEWLYELIKVLNRGNVDAFNALVDSSRERYFAQPVLVAKHEDVKKKIVLMCILNIFFERHPHDRSVTFNTIADRTRLPISEVEWVLMRAMSLGLIKGVIDQVEQVVEVSWVQPRVLEKDQLRLVSQQLEAWTQRVKSTLVTVEDQTPELYV